MFLFTNLTRPSNSHTSFAGIAGVYIFFFSAFITARVRSKACNRNYIATYPGVTTLWILYWRCYYVDNQSGDRFIQTPPTSIQISKYDLTSWALSTTTFTLKKILRNDSVNRTSQLMVITATNHARKKLALLAQRRWEETNDFFTTILLHSKPRIPRHPIRIRKQNKDHPISRCEGERSGLNHWTTICRKGLVQSAGYEASSAKFLMHERSSTRMWEHHAISAMASQLHRMWDKKTNTNKKLYQRFFPLINSFLLIQHRRF